jgi:hypothetical protein
MEGQVRAAVPQAIGTTLGSHMRRSKSKKQQLVCPYCLRAIVGRVENEHVFPASWYPDGTDPTIQRLTVPSCGPCNREFGKIEKRLWHTWGLCLSHKGDANRGIAERVISSLNPSHAKLPRDAYFREKTRDSIVARSQVLDPGSTGAFPGLGTPQVSWGRSREGLWVKGAPGLRLDAKDVEAFTRKLVRGLFFLSSGQPLPSDCTIQTFVASEESRPLWQKMIRQFKMRAQGVPPGFVFWAKVVDGCPLCSLWFFLVWGCLFLQAATLPPVLSMPTAEGCCHS